MKVKGIDQISNREACKCVNRHAYSRHVSFYSAIQTLFVFTP